MGRTRRLEAQQARDRATKRWPQLSHLLICHFNQDYHYQFGSLDGAFTAAAGSGPTAHRTAALTELRDWNGGEGAVEDIRPLLQLFGVDLRFKSPEQARLFMDRLQDELISSIEEETAR